MSRRLALAALLDVLRDRRRRVRGRAAEPVAGARRGRAATSAAGPGDAQHRRRRAPRQHARPGLPFTDHTGKKVKLGDYFDGKRPVLLTMNYFRCPVLCNVQLNELTETLHDFDWTPGDEHFRIVTVSIDPREQPSWPAAKRATHLEALGRGDAVDWEFLTGDALSIRLLAAQLGIQYAYDPEQDQYAHPAVVMFASPEGKIARYVYGLSYRRTTSSSGSSRPARARRHDPRPLHPQLFPLRRDARSLRPVCVRSHARRRRAVTVLLIGTALLIYWRRERPKHPRGGKHVIFLPESNPGTPPMSDARGASSPRPRPTRRRWTTCTSSSGSSAPSAGHRRSARRSTSWSSTRSRPTGCTARPRR
jgi:protein SCO1/2